MRVALASFLCGPDQLFTEGGEVEEKKVLKIQHLCCAGLGNHGCSLNKTKYFCLLLLLSLADAAVI